MARTRIEGILLIALVAWLGAGKARAQESEAPRAGRGGPAVARTDPRVDAAILAGLRWLARHQAEDGRWSCQDFPRQCHRVIREGHACGGPGYPEYDTGVTGFALLAFLRAGVALDSAQAPDGVRFGDVIRKGVKWLMASQFADGQIGEKSAAKVMYNHVIAAQAVAEAYRLTGSADFRDAARKAVDYLVQARNPDKAWRYTFRGGDNETGITSWALEALRCGEEAGFPIPEACKEGIRDWYAEATGDDFRTGYTERGTGKVAVQGKNEQFDHHEAMTAAAIPGRIFLGEDAADEALRGSALLLLADLPEWDGMKIDYYYWYHGTRAMRAFDGPDGPFWKAWKDRIRKALLPHQRTEGAGCAAGSWDTEERWSFEGGRVYGAAINVLTLVTVRGEAAAKPAGPGR